MTTAIKRRRGTTSQHSTFTGLEGEITIDTTKDTVVVHDGSTAGGFPLAKENNPTFTGTATIPTVDINGGTIDGAVIGGASAAAGTFTTGQFNTSLNVDGTVTADGLTVDTNTLHVDSTNNRVGIGTTDPKFHLQTDNGGLDSRGSGAGIAIRNNIYYSSGDKYLTASGAASTQYFDGSGNIIFYNTGTASSGAGNAVSLSERMRITSDGDIHFPIATNAMGKFADDISEVGDGNFALQISNTAQSALKPFGIRAEDIRFATGSSERMRIDSSGNVGIGASSVDQMLHVEKSSGTTIVKTEVASGSTVGFEIAKTGSTTQSWRIVDGATVNGVLEFYDLTNTATRMAINSSGNVGIGTSSPDKALTISASDSQVRLYDADGTNQFASFQSDSGTTKITSRNNTSHGTIAFQRYNGTTVAESMRIDNSGQLMVGMSSSSGTANGLRVIPSDFLGFTTSASDFDDRLVLLNRQASDGAHIEFRTANSTVARIGILNADPWIARSGGNGFRWYSGAVVPSNDAGATADNVMDLGSAIGRFKNLYLSSGVYVGGTGSANHLDDYEEGDWTPASDISLTNNTQAKYVKVGKSVIVTFDITFGSSSSSTTAKITNLPFSSTTYNSGIVGWTNIGHGLVLHVHGQNANFYKSNDASARSYAQMASYRAIGTISYVAS